MFPCFLHTDSNFFRMSTNTPPRNKNAQFLTQLESTPASRKASGYKNFQAQRHGYETNRRAMSREMTGNWVGPCPVQGFFNLTMPLEENAEETLADIPTTFFTEFHPKNERDVYKKMV